jgi:hypothetical protein
MERMGMIVITSGNIKSRTMNSIVKGSATITGRKLAVMTH